MILKEKDIAMALVKRGKESALIKANVMQKIEFELSTSSFC